MRYLILSDLHSNLEALQAVLAAADGAYEKIVCCGDLVGYGPDPDPTVEWTRTNVTDVVRGNHDKACSGITDADDFSSAARIAAYWTREHLSPENTTYLRNLPQGPHAISNQFGILHGSPGDEDEYLTTSWEAAESFGLLRHRVSFFGHTHRQGGFVKRGNRIIELPAQAKITGKERGKLKIAGDETYLLNPGSVGQPRDGDNRAAFAIFDTDGLVEYGRASYDIQTTIKKIIAAGLPDFLAHRLKLGR